MTVEVAMSVDGDKYMWDGAEYASEEEAKAQASKYEGDGFQTQVVPGDEAKFLVYSRRAVTEIVLEGEAPAG